MYVLLGLSSGSSLFHGPILALVLVSSPLSQGFALSTIVPLWKYKINYFSNYDPCQGQSWHLNIALANDFPPMWVEIPFYPVRYLSHTPNKHWRFTRCKLAFAL